MRVRLDRSLAETLVDQARAQIVSALHAGLLKPADRLPSLRRVAGVSGLNVKTVHRVYAQLRQEGLVDLRPGSGAFVAALDRIGLDWARSTSLGAFLRRHLDEAGGNGLGPSAYLALLQRFVTRSALSGKSVVVLECNHEQVRLFAREITSRLGARAHPLTLAEAARPEAGALLRSASVLAVTDFHAEAGRAFARGLGKPLVLLRVRREFIAALMDAARRGRLVMVVSDTAFFPALLQALAQLGLERGALERIHAVAGNDRAQVRRAAAGADSVYLSPLCDRSLARLLPAGARLLCFEEHLSAGPLRDLESWLLLSGALGPADPVGP